MQFFHFLLFAKRGYANTNFLCLMLQKLSAILTIVYV